MAIFMVSYDLRKKDEFDYEELWAAFRALDSVKFQESAYFVSSNSSIAEIKAYFRQHMHPDDLLMVVEFTEKPDYTKALAGTNAWIKAHW